MKLTYFKETDTLYIDLSSSKSNESIEIDEGLVADIDESGHITGIEIEHASHVIDFSNFSVEIPFKELLSNTKGITKVA
jgi:uncharacterized protein YuzE